MNDIKAKALALVNELFTESGGSPIDYAALFVAGDIVTLALLRAIEQREATKRELSDFRQEASDAVEAITEACNDHANTVIQLRAELSDFRQAVSDAVEDTLITSDLGPATAVGLSRFIIPKSDPLVEVIAGWTGGTVLLASDLRAALDARGLEIREKNDG